MPKFFTVRTLPSYTEEQIASGTKRAITIGEEIGVGWIKSYYSTIDGKLYCEREATDVEAIYELGRLLQSPIDSVSLIAPEFDPSMFK